MKQIVFTGLLLSIALLLQGCIVTYGPAVYNRTGQRITVFAHEQEKGRLSGIVVTNGTGVHLGFEDESIYKIECFADDGSLLMSVGCNSNLFLNSETSIILDSEEF